MELTTTQVSCCVCSMKFVSVKDVDSDMDVLEDEGDMDSELEESRPSNPRPTRNGLMAAKQMGDLFSMSS